MTPRVLIKGPSAGRTGSFRTQLQSKALLHVTPPGASHPQGTAVEILRDPFPLQRQFENRGAEGPAEVGAPLTPVNAGVGESPPQGASRFNIDAELRQSLRSGGSHVVRVAAARASSQPGKLLESIV